jgi:hypothetical protein
MHRFVSPPRKAPGSVFFVRGLRYKASIPIHRISVCDAGRPCWQPAGRATVRNCGGSSDGGERKEGEELRTVLGAAAVVHLPVCDLAFDHAVRSSDMCDLLFKRRHLTCAELVVHTHSGDDLIQIQVRRIGIPGINCPLRRFVRDFA